MENIKKAGKREYNVAVKEVQQVSGEKMINGYIDIDKLKPTQYLDDRNLAEYKQLVKDEVAPIVVDYNGKTFDIYDGHHRLNAYKALGVKKVPITVNESAKSQLTDIWNKANKK
jgi:ParB-like chromosome segregation protein Spo0J